MKVDEILYLMAPHDIVIVMESETGCTLRCLPVEEVPWEIRDMEALGLRIYDDDTLQINV